MVVLASQMTDVIASLGAVGTVYANRSSSIRPALVPPRQCLWRR